MSVKIKVSMNNKIILEYGTYQDVLNAIETEHISLNNIVMVVAYLENESDTNIPMSSIILYTVDMPYMKPDEYIDNYQSLPAMYDRRLLTDDVIKTIHLFKNRV